jgi:hypothetical protein
MDRLHPPAPKNKYDSMLSCSLIGHQDANGLWCTTLGRKYHEFYVLFMVLIATLYIEIYSVRYIYNSRLVN